MGTWLADAKTSGTSPSAMACDSSSELPKRKSASGASSSKTPWRELAAKIVRAPESAAPVSAVSPSSPLHEAASSAAATKNGAKSLTGKP